MTPIPHLTPRERQIVVLLAHEGLSNREIGERLKLEPGSVKVYMANIFRKLELEKSPGTSKARLLVAIWYWRGGKEGLEGESQ